VGARGRDSPGPPDQALGRPRPPQAPGGGDQRVDLVIVAADVDGVAGYGRVGLDFPSVSFAQRGPECDPDVDNKYVHGSRDEDENPDNPWADLRKQAEEFC